MACPALRADRDQKQADWKMTGDQSRGLKVGDRVCWGVTITDLGTVVGTSWSEVAITWDDGEASSVSHNDMAKVERVPTKNI